MLTAKVSAGAILAITVLGSDCPRRDVRCPLVALPPAGKRVEVNRKRQGMGITKVGRVAEPALHMVLGFKLQLAVGPEVRGARSA